MNRFIPTLTIIFFGLIAYSNTAHVPFMFDDSVRIEHNLKIRTLWPPFLAMSESNRPIVNYTFAINYAVHGYEVMGYHVLNTLIHLSAGLCLFGITRRTLEKSNGLFAKRSTYLALAVALIWVVHPLQTQAVTYINQRYESLMGLFFLLTLYCFIRSIDSNSAVIWRILSVIACGLGMGCKEAMACAPVVILWYDRAFVSPTWKKLIAQRWKYYFFLASTWAILAWAMLHYTAEYTEGGMVVVENTTPWTYLLSQSEVITHYLKLAIWPRGQCFFGKWPIAQSIGDVIPQGPFIVAILAGTIWSIYRLPMVGFLGGWFFLILAPTSSFIPIRDFIFEHRMYLPLAAVVTILVCGFYWLLRQVGLSEKQSLQMHGVVAIAAAIGLTSATYLRNQVYKTELSIWQDTVAKAPHHAAAWHNVGLSLVNLGKYSDALPYLAKSYELAPHDPHMASAYGSGLLEAGDYEAAKKLLSEAIQGNPKDHVALRNMGNLLLDAGNGAEALGYCERAMQLAPPDAELQMSYVAALIVVGRFDDAINQCHKTLRQHPEYLKAHLNLVAAYSQLNNQEKAIEHLQFASKLAPNDAQVQWALGKMLAKDRPQEAIAYIRSAISIDPENVEARYKLVSLLVTCNQLEKAIEEMDTILKLRPDSKAAHDYYERLRKASSLQSR